MKLTDVIDDLGNLDEELIIFLEDAADADADILLAKGVDGDGGVKVENGRQYTYLIEVSLAKEFLDDWKTGLDYVPGKDEMAKRLYEYAVNDA
ncbi:hypothetical protein [Chitinophaga barathri]|uniref:Uncharacterized protein n=1 Tax=Chitinophaga barathri TaxID=1647451 RepID=A0A3N4MSZ1_9BACT|nr:hypothetical protein [Chitinophaga barathri]RPD42649.1 hypothetical protein EG028_05650 [Chitinophaga barathri]